jgi:DNA-binding NtrC family response regulator
LETEPVNKKILLIEHDEEFRITMTRLLGKEGFSVISTEDTLQAKTYLDKMPFDLIIYGLNSPLRESLDYLKDLKSHKQKCEILVLSSFNWCEIQGELNLMNVRELLIKPIKKENLINSILKIEKLNI